MSDAKELRERARQARRAASIRTVSGQAGDRQLLALAIRLDRQAEELERKQPILKQMRP